MQPIQVVLLGSPQTIALLWLYIVKQAGPEPGVPEAHLCGL